MPPDTVFTWYTTEGTASTSSGTTIFNYSPASSAAAPDSPEFIGPPELPEFPIFPIQQDTHGIALRELEQHYPYHVRNGDFQQSYRTALVHERRAVTGNIRNYRRVQLLRQLYDTLPTNQHQFIREFANPWIEARELRRIEAGQEPIDGLHYRAVRDSLQAYIDRKRQHINNRREYGPLQAEYHQRAAMIRQRPLLPAEIDTAVIMETVKQWENVFAVGIDIVREPFEDAPKYLLIKLGLCDIVMSESAGEDSVYDDPMDLLLAPLSIEIRLDRNGRFQCRSNKAHGLSRYNSSGLLDSDFHPHQLSDNPCFGSFGQSFIDFAGRGDMLALISGLIAFYSQYNSEDSAGVNARYHHPSHIVPPRDRDEYLNGLGNLFDDFGGFIHFDNAKLEAAMDRYMAYHAANIGADAPQLQCTHICYNCDDANVSDGHEYYYDANGNRVCPVCWDDSYCSECETHFDDCTPDTCTCGRFDE